MRTYWARDGLVHHSDAGSRIRSVSFAETLALEDIAASIGDVYDNALTESMSTSHRDASGATSLRQFTFGAKSLSRSPTPSKAAIAATDRADALPSP